MHAAPEASHFVNGAPVEDRAGAPVDGVAGLLGADPEGDELDVGEAFALGVPAGDALGHGGAADVAQADEGDAHARGDAPARDAGAAGDGADHLRQPPNEG